MALESSLVSLVLASKLARACSTHVSQLREAPFAWKSDAGIDIARRVATKNLMGNQGAEPGSQRPRKLRVFFL